MKTFLLPVSFLGAALFSGFTVAGLCAPAIRLNSVGYLPENEKIAAIAGAGKKFWIQREPGGARVFEGPVSEASTNTDTGELLARADFSRFQVPGQYRLVVEGLEPSAPFRIAADVYQAPFVTVVRGMYLWRCGMAVSGVHNGSTLEHAACHTNDAWLDVVAGQHIRSNSLGGWHDAGDYNKYVVNAGVTVGCMFRAWEEFGPAISKVPLHLPEAGGALPEFLAELKWELDWLLTMQFEDGSVSHKVSTKKFGGFILPEKEVEDRFFTPWSSAATADFVAMMAQAARCFRPYDTAYADRCLRAARKSYGFLAAHGEDHPANLAGFSTGAYGTRDGDDRLWAAAEMWETTGEADALRDLETRIGNNEARLDRNWDWGNVNNLGMLTYLFSKRNGRNEDLLEKARTNAVAVADELVTARNAHGYGRPLGTMYYWGCNGTVARQVLNLVAANRITPKPAYRETALDALNHLFGRNCFGRSFVTGVGANPPMHPHDRRSGGDNVVEPWPGYLVGGPNPKAENWNDVQGDYRTNEIAINWNGALIYALAAFLGGGA